MKGKKEPHDVHRVLAYGDRQRLDAYLTRYVGEHTRSQWHRLIASGMVTVNGAEARPSLRLAAGDRLEIQPSAPMALLEPDPTIELNVVYEDAAIVVLDKPAGLVVHPAPGHQSGTLVHALLARFPELADPAGASRPGIVHRLDKDTSGLMVVGKTPDAVATLQREMQRGGVRKRYRLLVLGDLEEDEGVIDAPMGRDRLHRQRMAVRSDGRPARTEFRVLERFSRKSLASIGFTLVDAGLPSGRTHQLRVHFAFIRHPVAGDRTYGSGKAPEGLARQFVHSFELALTSPATGAPMVFTAELPDDLDRVLQHLRRESAGRWGQ